MNIRSSFFNSHLPSKLIYEQYKDWLKTNNYGSQPIKIKEFSQRFNKEIILILYNIFNNK